MRYAFRVLAIISALSAALLLLFWMVDVWERLPFRLGWALVSSLLWMTIFGLLSRWKKIPS